MKLDEKPLRGELVDSPEFRRARLQRRIGWWSTLVACAVLVAVMSQLYRLLGHWWLVIGAGGVFAFALGWGAAYRHWRKHGYVPRL